MKEFLQTVLKTSEERIKNPIIGSFLSSWIIFNWKPLLFFLLTSKKIEQKISFIEENYSKIWNLLWLPLVSTFIYLILLPYINLLIEMLLNYSQNKRTDLSIAKQKLTIESQKQLAIEEIKLEEAKTEYRERNSHNKLIEELQNKIISVEKDKNLELDKSKEYINTLKGEMNSREESFKTQIINLEKRYSNSLKEHSQLNVLLRRKETELNNLKLNHEVSNSANITLQEYVLSNGRVIEEKLNSMGNKYYIDKNSRQSLPENKVQRILENEKLLIKKK